MNQAESNWNHLVVAVLQRANELQVSEPVIVGTFMACAVAAARKSGANLDNLIQLVIENWHNTDGTEIKG
jgi:hypothetical protein